MSDRAQLNSVTILVQNNIVRTSEIDNDVCILHDIYTA